MVSTANINISNLGHIGGPIMEGLVSNGSTWHLGYCLVYLMAPSSVIRKGSTKNVNFFLMSFSKGDVNGENMLNNEFL